TAATATTNQSTHDQQGHYQRYDFDLHALRRPFTYLPCYCFSSANSAGESESRVRYGKKGVTSNGIFSCDESNDTDLIFIISSLLFQGSSLIRPPNGRAAICSIFAFSSCGAVCSSAGIRTVLLVPMPLPR